MWVSLLLRLAPWALAVAVFVAGWWHVSGLARARDSALAGQAATAQALAVETAAKTALVTALTRSNAALAEREAAERVLERRQAERRGNLEQSIRAPDAQPWAAARLPGDVYAGLRAAASGRHNAGASPDATAGVARRD